MGEIWLSKSKINMYLNCPHRYKLIYIDGLKEPVSEVMIRGSNVHKDIENFYKNGVEWKDKDYFFKPVNVNLKNFIEFERKRAEKCKKHDNPKKYFMPVFVEKKIKNKVLKVSGIIDAVFYDYNEGNGDYIIIDWKTGKFRENYKSNYRRELAIYKILLDNSGLLDKPIKYYGMFFTDANHLFFEEAKNVSVKAAYKMILNVRNKIRNSKFGCNITPLCNWCGFKKSCSMD